MSIYTKSGDGGLASTMNRRSIPKNAPVFALLGDLDELGSALGVARGKLPADTREIVKALQQDLISFCGEIAGGERFATAKRVASMEESIDMMMGAAGQFEGFVIPGGSPGGAALDLARAVARRAERELVACKQTGGVSREAMMYLNRLSDLLYALARFTDAREGEPNPAPGTGVPPVPETTSPNARTIPAASATEPMPAGSFMDTALWLCRQVVAHARETMNLPVVAACCDGGGNEAALLRADGAYIASVDVARNKAYTSVSLQMPTEDLAELCKPGGQLYGLQQTNGGRIVIFGGGFPLLRGGALIGGFGVSGGSAEQDTNLARWARALFEQQGGR